MNRSIFHTKREGYAKCDLIFAQQSSMYSGPCLLCAHLSLDRGYPEGKAGVLFIAQSPALLWEEESEWVSEWVKRRGLSQSLNDWLSDSPAWEGHWGNSWLPPCPLGAGEDSALLALCTLGSALMGWWDRAPCPCFLECTGARESHLAGRWLSARGQSSGASLSLRETEAWTPPGGVCRDLTYLIKARRSQCPWLAPLVWISWGGRLPKRG